MDFHAECEEHFLVEDTLEDETRSRTDFLDLGSSLSDHDDFLTLGFDIDIGLDREHRGFPIDLLLDLAYFDIGRIRDFFPELTEEYFTDHFYDTQIHRLVGIVVTLVEVRTFWKVDSDLLDKFFESCPIHRVDIGVDIFSEVSLREILLGLDTDDGCLREGHDFVDTLILDSLDTSRVDQSEYYVSLTQGRECF